MAESGRVGKSQTEAGGYEQLRRFALAAEAGLLQGSYRVETGLSEVGIGAGVTGRKHQSAPPREHPKHPKQPGWAAWMGVERHELCSFGRLCSPFSVSVLAGCWGDEASQEPGAC